MLWTLAIIIGGLLAVAIHYGIVAPDDAEPPCPQWPDCADGTCDLVCRDCPYFREVRNG